MRHYFTTILRYLQSSVIMEDRQFRFRGVSSTRAVAVAPIERQESSMSNNGPGHGDRMPSLPCGPRNRQSSKLLQVAVRRNDATPAMNICTDKAISSIPITRSNAVSTLSPSQRNK